MALPTYVKLIWLTVLISGGLISQEPDLPPTLPTHSVLDAKKEGWSNPADVQYWRALTNASSAPSLLVITVFDSRSNQPKTYCTNSRFFLAALGIEHRLGNSTATRSELVQIAMSMRGQPIRFTSQKALSNIPQRYSKTDLKWAISRISKLTNQELIAGFSSQSDPSFESVLLGNRPKTRVKRQFALAHAIYQRGLSVGLGCVASNLWVNE